MDPTCGRDSVRNPSWQETYFPETHFTSVSRKANLRNGGPYAQKAKLDVNQASGQVSAVVRDHWVAYKARYLTDRTGHECKIDLLFYHGFAEYGDRHAECISELVKAGHRVFVVDMPGHGRSTGPHGHIAKAEDLVSACFSVIADANLNWKSFLEIPLTKIAISGFSLGGLGALLCGLYYSNRAYDWSLGQGVEIAGVYALAPVTGMTDGASWNSNITRRLVALINPWLGRLPLLPASSDGPGEDPAVWNGMIEDPLCYTGNMRLSIAGCGLDGMNDVHVRASTFDIPIRILHGSRDLNTSPMASQELIEKIGRNDASFRLMVDYDHALMKVKSPDSSANEEVLKDWLQWLASLEHDQNVIA